MGRPADQSRRGHWRPGLRAARGRPRPGGHDATAAALAHCAMPA